MNADKLIVQQKMSEERQHDDEGLELQAWTAKKADLLASALGQLADFVGHSIIPFEAGGGLDEYYFYSPKTGTALATQELSILPDQGPSNDRMTTYEFVMFTRQPLRAESFLDEASCFGRDCRRMSAILNVLARYSHQATLDRFETCGFPEDFERIGGAIVIFDEFFRIELGDGLSFGLLAAIEILESEFEYCQENGGEALIDLLKSDGVYPFSNADRSPVV